MKIRIFLRLPDDPPDSAEAKPEAENGSCQENEEQGRLRPGQ
jgi:hypothetical protein